MKTSHFLCAEKKRGKEWVIEWERDVPGFCVILFNIRLPFLNTNNVINQLKRRLEMMLQVIQGEQPPGQYTQNTTETLLTSSRLLSKNRREKRRKKCVRNFNSKRTCIIPSTQPRVCFKHRRRKKYKWKWKQGTRMRKKRMRRKWNDMNSIQFRLYISLRSCHFFFLSLLLLFAFDNVNTFSNNSVTIFPFCFRLELFRLFSLRENRNAHSDLPQK